MTAAPVAGLSGKWTMLADAQGQVIQLTVEFKQDGAGFTGATFSQLGNGTIVGGKVSGKSFSATLKADVQGNAVDFTMDGTVDGNKMSGTLANAAFGSIPFSATKDK